MTLPLSLVVQAQPGASVIVLAGQEEAAGRSGAARRRPKAGTADPALPGEPRPAPRRPDQPVRHLQACQSLGLKVPFPGST